MNATFQFLVVVLAILGSAWNSHRELVQMEKRFEERFLQLEKRLDDRFKAMEDRFRALEDRVARIERQLEQIFKPAFPPKP
jgi:CII-binding regulator of phage lambda lysogenization HflD